MNMPPAVEQMTARFDAMSLRERALVAVCTLAGIVMVWMLAVLDPISAKQRALDAERTSLEEQIASTQTANENDPTTLALAKEKKLTANLTDIDAQLESKSAGLIPPERMVQVIHDVLSRQRGLSLVSLHNKPVTSLVPKPAAHADVAMPSETTDADATQTVENPTDTVAVRQIETGPYVHPIEIVIEGSYLDILAYLKTLEDLEWRFNWRLLDLETTRYPVNRVRIELSTLSMDKDWIGV